MLRCFRRYYSVALVLLSTATSALAQVPTVTSVVNVVSPAGQLSPGMLALVGGTGFGSNAANVTVTVGGKPGYVTFANPTLLGAQIPFEASVGATTLTIAVNGVMSAPFNIVLDTYAPAICNGQNTCGEPFFAAGGSKQGQVVTAAEPASPGDILGIYAVGLGPTNPAT